MDWTLAIDRNRDALLRILTMLFAMVGPVRDDASVRLPRHVRVAVWAVLRPAEAAFRRLLVFAERVWEFDVRVVVRPVGRAMPVVMSGASGERLPAFALFDRRRHFDFKSGPPVTKGNPRIWSPGMDYPVFVTKKEPSPDDMVTVDRMLRRMLCLQRALNDLPKQARRLARWQAKRRADPGARKYPPMRPGRPPGHRARRRHPVDYVLNDCHELALYALKPPDTS